MTASRTFVGVVFGGASREHNVSIKSAATVLKALKSGINRTQFKAIPIYIDIKGRWWPKDLAQQALEKGEALNEKELPLSFKYSGFQGLPKESKEIEVWYPILHGPNGEDGVIQGLFKLIGKPFVGSGVLASAVGMDKLAMKAAFASAGLPQVTYCAANSEQLIHTNLRRELIQKLETQIKYPCFVKPANLGSSVGITKAHNNLELIAGLEEAAKLDSRIIIEKAVVAKELECAVLGVRELKASEVGEIRFKADWYDYEAKYSADSSQMVIPAPIPNSIKRRVQALTLKACKAINANSMARVDFFYKEDNDELWVNEINTLPGFTSQSMYPKLWEASGVTLEQLVAKLIEIARE